MKFHENSQLRAALVHAGRRKDRQTDMAKLIDVFLGYANAPNYNNQLYCSKIYTVYFS
jgi:hypothetical protein